MKKISFLVIFTLSLSAMSCNTEKTRKHTDFETSYWIDIDLSDHAGEEVRGYWTPYYNTLPEEEKPSAGEVCNSVKVLAEEYGADKLYVVYHRQFEIETAKEIFNIWNAEAAKYDVEIVPAVVLEEYSAETAMNFTDRELVELAQWCLVNICSEEFGVYDVYARMAPDSDQDKQLAVLKANVGDVLVRIGLQPGEKLNPNCKSGVEDTWTAECQGLTNELWSRPLKSDGNGIIGRKLLEAWVRERVATPSIRIVWDMIPVAWDYENPVDEYGYLCPGDDARINDAPIPGRIRLCHECISSCYEGGMMNPSFGGYSCDLHILNANSSWKDNQTFYKQLKDGIRYSGYFSSAMDQIGELYKSLE